MNIDSPISIAAVGDLSLNGRRSETPSVNVFSTVLPIFQKSDLVIANLESPLIAEGRPVTGKCTLKGSPGWAGVLKEAEIELVSLANNHIMDFGPNGLVSTIGALDAAGIRYVGAGRNREEACAPLFVPCQGRRIAFLARSSVIVSSPCYAEKNTPGAAFLDLDETARSICFCRREADVVVLLLHWGLEEYRYPSPEQRRIASDLAAAGVDILIGHHPHVLQGTERVGKGFVAYSLGNFLFDRFEWEYIDARGEEKKAKIDLTDENRKGVILRFALGRRGLGGVQKVFTRIEEEGAITIDYDSTRGSEFMVLSGALTRRFHGCWWRMYSLRREWDLRLKDKVSLGKSGRRILRVRPRHIRDVLKALTKSAGIASGKTTNPYE